MIDRLRFGDRGGDRGGDVGDHVQEMSTGTVQDG